MNRAVLIIIGIIVVLISMLAIHGYMQPNPFRWNQTYLTSDRQPYGAYVAHQQARNLFPGNELMQAGNDLFDQYIVYAYQDSALGYLKKIEFEEFEKFNFIGLDSDFTISNDDARSLLIHVFQGNHALVGFNYVDGILLEELGIEVATKYATYEDEQIDDNPVLSNEEFEVKFLDEDWTQLKRTHFRSYFDTYPEDAEVIGTNRKNDVLAIRLEVGEGTLTLVSMPLVFTNYCLLKTNPSISEKLFASLPNTDTYWARGRWSWDYPAAEDSPSLLSFIHSQQSLTWAFYVLLFSVLVFFFFEIKRQQRPIPVINPPENVSLKFSESISRLYLLKKDHREMIRKKMKYLMEQIRNEMHIDTSKIDDHFYAKLSSKSGVEKDKIKELFTLYYAFKDISEMSPEQFLKFNRLIQLFKFKKR